MTHETVPLYGGQLSRRVTIRDLRTAKERGERWPMLTSYDMYTAEIFDAAGIPVLLVGDSAGNNVYAHPDTVPVTVEELVPLARAVVRSTSRALVVSDLPFGSYQLGPEQALATSIRVMKEAGVQAVKLEGGRRWSSRCGASSRPASRSWRTSGSRRRASTRWAATACRAAAPRRTG